MQAIGIERLPGQDSLPHKYGEDTSNGGDTTAIYRADGGSIQLVGI